MNRRDRRAASASNRHQNPEEGPKKVVALLTTAMAARGPSIRSTLEAAVNGPVRPGHVADALIHAATSYVHHVESGASRDAFEDAVTVLWLARALAISDGKLSESQPTHD